MTDGAAPAGADAGEAPAVEVRGLDFAYGPVQVLFDVSLRVGRGEVVALLGPNGAGKSTLLRLVGGLDSPTRGDVLVHGRTVTDVPAERRARLGLVLALGGDAVFPGLTVDENLRMAGYLYARRNLAGRVAAALDRFPALATRRRAPARDLSGGQRQMLALAMALVHEPDVLLVDELTMGLAPIMVQDLVGTVRDLRDQGVTMLIVEQSLNVAVAVADRVAFLEKGEVRFDGPTAELARRDDLARAVFLGAGS